jgi:hypothetical protein
MVVQQYSTKTPKYKRKELALKGMWITVKGWTLGQLMVCDNPTLN